MATTKKSARTGPKHHPLAKKAATNTKKIKKDKGNRRNSRRNSNSSNNISSTSSKEKKRVKCLRLCAFGDLNVDMLQTITHDFLTG